MSAKTLLIGTGQMAEDYANVLTSQNVDFDVIGRGGDKQAVFS